MTTVPVRVLVVSPCFGAYGGIEACVLAIAEGLARDSRVELRICFKRAKDFALQPALAELCRSFPVTFCDRASRGLAAAIAWSNVVHCHHPSPDVAVVSRLLGKPLALSVHNVLPATRSLRRSSWRLAARLASVRWFNSHFVWNTWERNRRPRASRLVPPISRWPAMLVAPEARKGFVFLGRLVPGKGVEVLLDAYGQAGLDPIEWPLTILGDGPLRVVLEERLSAGTLRGVSFKGFTGGDAKDRAIAGAKWMVVPSNWGEPFGLVAVEARHAGVPCVVTLDGGLPEAAGVDALTCDPGDVAALARCLRTAATMPPAEYESRSVRTRATLAGELMPPSFYADEYVRLARGRRETP